MVTKSKISNSILRDIQIFEEDIKNNSTPSLLREITYASLLEQVGRTSEAKKYYQIVIDRDQEGTYSFIAKKALENLELNTIEKINIEKEQNPLGVHKVWHKLRWKNLSSHVKVAILSILITSFPLTVAQIIYNSIISSTLKEIRKEVSSVEYQHLLELENRFGKQQICINIFLIIVLMLIILVTIIVANSFARKVRCLAIFAQSLSLGRKATINDTYLQRHDEIGAIARSLQAIATINEMTLKTLCQEKSLRLRENEDLQNGMIELLMATQPVVDGNLTVRATAQNGITRSIADAFNVVVSNLEGLVLQVQNATFLVSASASDSQAFMLDLGEATATQIELVQEALNCVKAIEESIQSVAGVSQKVSMVAEHSLTSAKKGVESMEAAVDAVDLIDKSIAEVFLEIKQFTESSQEIYRIVDTISTISERTKLLGFNAKIKAEKVETGEKIDSLVEDIERLSGWIAQASQQIKDIVSTVQRGISGIHKNMETSSNQVEIGIKKITEAKLNFVEVVNNSVTVDRLLKSVIEETNIQFRTSKNLSTNIEFIVDITNASSSGLKKTLEAMENLLLDMQNLQVAVSTFKVNRFSKE